MMSAGNASAVSDGAAGRLVISAEKATAPGREAGNSPLDSLRRVRLASPRESRGESDRPPAESGV